jgi:hypothetical protein
LEKYLAKTRVALSSAADRFAPSGWSNITPREWTAFSKLTSNPDIKICSSDKNLGPALVTSTFYNEQLQVHFARAYRRLSELEALTIAREAITEIFNFATQRIKDVKLRQYVLSFLPPDTTAPTMRKRWCKFYLLIKLHKVPVATRGITASFTWITTGLAEWIDAVVAPWLKLVPTICASSDDVLRVFRTRRLPADTNLLTADVVSLYPSIPITNATFDLISQYMRVSLQMPHNLVADIVRAFKIVLTHHIILLNGVFRLQITGTAMGVSCAVVFANLFMAASIDSVAAQHCICYLRYQDDIKACLAPASLEPFLLALRTAHPSIAFTTSADPPAVPRVAHKFSIFLDLHLFKGPSFATTGVLSSRLYRKPMNLFLYIPFSSMHNRHSLSGFIKAEAIRIVKSSSHFTFYLDDLKLFIAGLRDRGYPFDFITTALSEVRYSLRMSYLYPDHKTPAVQHDTTGSPAVLTYPFDFDSFASIQPSSVLHEHWTLIAHDPDLARIFDRPLTAFRSNPPLALARTS